MHIKLKEKELLQNKYKGKELLKRELKDFLEDPDATDIFGVDYWDLDKPDILHWQVTMYGPVDTFYEGGYFLIKIDFEETYPKTKPKVNFRTKIYHSNVSQISGTVCISTLNEWESRNPRPTMKEVLEDIVYLLYNPTPEQGWGNFDEEYIKDISKFEKNAREWVKIYANVEDYDDPSKHYN